jgi:hypothetical protein
MIRHLPPPHVRLITYNIELGEAHLSLGWNLIVKLHNIHVYALILRLEGKSEE